MKRIDKKGIKTHVLAYQLSDIFTGDTLDLYYLGREIPHKAPPPRPLTNDSRIRH